MCFWRKKKIHETDPVQPLDSASFRVTEKAFSFPRVPATYEEFVALPEAALHDPFATAALTILALLVYKTDHAASLKMLDYLKGPQPLTNQEKQFLVDRLYGKDYKPFSYVVGATPQNNYTPVSPFVIKLHDGPASSSQAGYLTLYATSSGADSPRPIRLRQKGPDTWCLWEEFLLADIVAPQKDNPWA
jgi:hypothetical protein